MLRCRNHNNSDCLMIVLPDHLMTTSVQLIITEISVQSVHNFELREFFLWSSHRKDSIRTISQRYGSWTRHVCFVSMSFNTLEFVAQRWRWSSRFHYSLIISYVVLCKWNFRCDVTLSFDLVNFWSESYKVAVVGWVFKWILIP